MERDNHTTSNSFCDLQEKFVNLSRKIGYTIKSIKFLKKTISEEKRQYILNWHKKENDDKKSLEDMEHKYKSDFAAIIKKCDYHVDRKKALTKELEHVTKSKRVSETENFVMLEGGGPTILYFHPSYFFQLEEDRIRKASNDEYARHTVEMRRVRDEWKKDGEERLQNFNARKMDQIKRLTSKGMEPQLREIIAKHEAACNLITNCLDSEKKIVEDELRKKFDGKISKVGEASKTEIASFEEITRLESATEKNKIERSHEIYIYELRRAMSSEFEVQKRRRRNDLNELFKNHSTEVENLRHRQMQHVTYLMQDLEKSKNEQRRHSLDIDSYISRKEMDTLTEWEQNIREELQTRDIERLKKEKDAKEKQRDVTIENNIRILIYDQSITMTARLTKEEKAKLRSHHKKCKEELKREIRKLQERCCRCRENCATHREMLEKEGDQLLTMKEAADLGREKLEVIGGKINNIRKTSSSERGSF
eukprot:CAMPEP_0113331176 /NCGR_PEP_ID=MMETSP0010_2-20120614/22309_1 /TAXON_ID=216773 ORGANISM="Corethron hystrix, Strain 308" /NCGR_SAMPLE_ID=MMETSP0010_2 /ASSEMBLY_ACC=CAM_ASM_000155 /LENGTH=478 /DNA_ID=CAMNT_0000194345 /DNA_START=1045 /DNA_END=2481 /DNA_ORIENTATION=+ /assembly_acc=CAM_ASM_000155